MAETFEKFFEQTKTFNAPVVKASKLAVASLEKLVALQLSTLQSYTELTIARLKAATEVTDLKSLQGFATEQVELAKSLGQKVMDDAKAFADLGAGVKAEFDKLAEEAAAELPKTVQSFSKAA